MPVYRQTYASATAKTWPVAAGATLGAPPIVDRSKYLYALGGAIVASLGIVFLVTRGGSSSGHGLSGPDYKLTRAVPAK